MIKVVQFLSNIDGALNTNLDTQIGKCVWTSMFGYDQPEIIPGVGQMQHLAAECKALPILNVLPGMTRKNCVIT
jgi:hypothetical protein